MYFPLMHCYHKPLFLAACYKYLKSIPCFKEFCLSAVSKYGVSLLRVCGGEAKMFPYNSLAFISYCALRSEFASADNELNETSVTSLVVLICICSQLHNTGSSP